MRKYRYSYHTIVQYSAPVSGHQFMLRCTPSENESQLIVEQQMNMLTSAAMFNNRDVFGNYITYGNMMESHDIFVVASSGIVHCSEYKIRDNAPNPIYAVPTRVTQVSSEMLEMGAAVSKSGTPVEQARALAAEVNFHLVYTKGVTNTETTAVESFNLAKGVCQDYAHILIALCRERAIFARYVVGYVVGTGETHAWVEIFSEGAWYGIDPTYNLLIDYGYIKVAQGRDAADCSVIRGVYIGRVNSETQVKVVVEEIPI